MYIDSGVGESVADAAVVMSTVLTRGAIVIVLIWAAVTLWKVHIQKQIADQKLEHQERTIDRTSAPSEITDQG